MAGANQITTWNKAMFAVVVILLIAVATFLLYQHYNDANGLVNVTELDTLDRIRYTAIQMTILSLESEQPTNMSNDEIAAKIYEFQQSNKSNDRLTTVETEDLYRNITNGSQVGPQEQLIID